MIPESVITIVRNTQIDRERYATDVAAMIAERSSEMSAQIKTWHISHDIGLSNGELV